MRIYHIIHKGRRDVLNMVPAREIIFSDDYKIYVGQFFTKKKDALKYLRTISYPECYEVVGSTLDDVKIKKGKK